MWQKLFELEPKYIATIITSVGGILLCYVIFSAYQNLAEIKTTEVYNAVKELNSGVQGLKEASVQQVEATKQNTEATKELHQLILQTRRSSAGVLNINAQ